MRRQQIIKRLSFCHCESALGGRRSNLILCIITLSLVLGFTRLAWAISIPDVNIPGGSIDFQPNSGIPGDPVRVSICLFGFEEEVLGGVGVNIDGERKDYDVCHTFGPCGLNCNLGEILQFSCTNHTVSFSFVFVESLPLEFKNGEEGCPEPKLFVTIPGINDSGLTMLTRAANMVNDDLECTVTISEAKGLPEADVRRVVTDITKKAKEKGKDVIVNIDMNLEDYSWELILPPCPFEICIPTVCNPWHCSTRWAGKMANVVSDAFSKEVSGGKRILYAHSAGGDATFQSVYQSRGKRMYDDINIFNGRTSAINLKNVLKSRGYGWRQVKVFTNRGDCPANPFWALANYDVAKRYGGKSWVHLHCCDIMTCTDPLSFCGCHSALRDSMPDGIEGTFEVNLSPKTGTPDCTVPATVKELMTRDWR